MNTPVTLLLALVLSLHAPALAEESNHSHEGGTPHALKLNNGKKWETDDSARKGMQEIRDAVAAQISAIHENKLVAEKYAALSDQVAGAVNGMIKDCKLSPEADAVIHVLLAQMLEGAKAMKSAAELRERRVGAVKIVGALGQYPRYFAHPGWKPIKH